MEFAGAASNCSNVENDIKTCLPNVILMDINMPEVDGIEGLKRIKKFSPRTLVIMQTVFEDDDKIIEAIKSGANGYFLKRTSPEKLIDGIHEVMEGGAPMTSLVAAKVIGLFRQEFSENDHSEANLTPKEKEVLLLLTKGLSYKMISGELHISYHTVNTHVKKIYEKLQVHSVTEAIAKSKLLK
jgi:DNA-binding NarL/FixJ family response regulator